MASFFIRRGVHDSRSRILRRHTSYSDIFAYTNAKKLKLGRGRFLSNVNNGPRLWVAAAGPGYHSGRHHHKVRPTSPTSSKGPQTADHHFLHEKILISLQTGAAGNHSTERHVTVFFARGVRHCLRGARCRANSKIKGERGGLRLGNVVRA